MLRRCCCFFEQSVEEWCVGEFPPPPNPEPLKKSFLFPCQPNLTLVHSRRRDEISRKTQKSLGERERANYFFFHLEKKEEGDGRDEGQKLEKLAFVKAVRRIVVGNAQNGRMRKKYLSFWAS